MSNPLTEQVAKPSVIILGLGRSGLAAISLALQQKEQVLGLDEANSLNQKAQDYLDQQSSKEALQLFSGSSAIEALETLQQEGAINADTLLILSPGIPPESTLLQKLLQCSCSVISEIEYAYRYNQAQNTPSQIIAITGTNGKTTTTGLSEAILLGAGHRAIAAGNYGAPFSEVILHDPPPEIIALEVSSFQLEEIVSFSPDVAVWLNFAPDHLDRYSDLESYRAAKLRIFEKQTPQQKAVVQSGSELPSVEAEITFFSSDPDCEADYQLSSDFEILHRGKAVIDLKPSQLRGRHNGENAMAAVAACSALGVDYSEMQSGLNDFTPPPHRCQLVRDHLSCDWINDSKATNLHALVSSLNAYNVHDAKEAGIILIIGGKDKGLDYHSDPLFARLLQEKVFQLICLGEIGEQLNEDFLPIVSSQFAKSLEEAVRLSNDAAERANFTQQGVVLFSPGTSSFDMFSGYQERGEKFIHLVNQL